MNVLAQLRSARQLLIDMGNQTERIRELDALILRTIDRLMDVADELD